MKQIFTLALLLTIYNTSYSQNTKEIPSNGLSQIKDNSYVYITVQGKDFSKKLKVIVDFGDTPELIKLGQEYSDLLTNKKSYAAILNYMAENQFTLVESRDIVSSFQGTGGSAGIILIMRKTPVSHKTN